MKMFRLFAIMAAGALLQACTSTPNSTRNVAAPPGAPQGGPSSATIDRIDPPGRSGLAAENGVAKPGDVLYLPAAYRVMLVDGQMALVKETDAEMIRPGPVALRVVAGDVARGDLSYQPALLPQELATEVAKLRISQSQEDEANLGMLQKGDQLLQQAKILQAQNMILAKRLAEIATYTKRLEEQIQKNGGALPNPPGHDAAAPATTQAGPTTTSDETSH